MACERLFSLKAFRARRKSRDTARLIGAGGIGTTAADAATRGRCSCRFAVSGGCEILAAKLH